MALKNSQRLAKALQIISSFPWWIPTDADEVCIRSLLQKRVFDRLRVGSEWGMIADYTIRNDSDGSIILLYLDGSVWNAITKNHRDATGGEDDDLVSEVPWAVYCGGVVRET